MKKHIFYIVLLLFLGLAAHTNAQTDKWTGTWRMEYKPWPGRPPLIIELQVGLPGQQTLYPALLKLDYGNTFHGVYELLLATKSATQLDIGRFGQRRHALAARTGAATAAGTVRRGDCCVARAIALVDVLEALIHPQTGGAERRYAPSFGDCLLSSLIVGYRIAHQWRVRDTTRKFPDIREMI